jgi:hypothetical protein
MSTCRHCGEPTGGFNDGFKSCGRCSVLLAGLTEPEPAPVPTLDEDARASLEEIRQAEKTRLERVWLANRLSLVLRWNEFPASPVVRR